MNSYVCEAVGTLSGPAIYYRRIDTQAIGQGEATAHATVQNISFSDDRCCGPPASSRFDYPLGNGNQYQGVKYTGVVDLFRVPKSGAAIYSAVDGSSLPELRIDGYLASAKVTSRSFDANPSHDRLQLTADDTVIDADGSDETRLAFRAVDRYGNARPYVDGLVTLSITGAAMLVEDNPLDFGQTGGTGAVWVRSLPGSPGVVTVHASHASLGTAEVTIKIQEVPNAPVPIPYGRLAVNSG